MISTIAIIGKNRAIGRKNQLLWHIPEDLKHFKTITEGHVIIMGQKTFESIGKPLPNRTTIVLSNDPEFNVEGVVVARTFDEVFEKANELEKEEIFICGGGSIYAQTIDKADKLYLTVVDDAPEDADTFFPEYSEFKNVVSKEEVDNGKYKFTFMELTR